MPPSAESKKQNPAPPITARFENQTLELLEGRIQCQAADVLVSPDNNYLTHGSGASEALWEAAGGGLEEWWNGEKQKVRLSLGDVLSSGAFNLEADYLLHSVTVDFDANRRLRPLDARILYRAIFDKAAELGARTVALPLLGAGGGDLGCELSATALLQAVARRASQRAPALTVRIVESNSEAFLKVAQIVKQESDRRLSLWSLLKALGQREQEGANGMKSLELWLSEEDPSKAIILCFDSLLKQWLAEEIRANPGLGSKLDAADIPLEAAGFGGSEARQHENCAVHRLEDLWDRVPELGDGTPKDLLPAIRAAIHSGSGARSSFLHSARLEAALEARYVHVMYDACFILALYLTNPGKLREILHVGDGRSQHGQKVLHEADLPKTEEEKQKEWLGADFEAVVYAEGVDEGYIPKAPAKPLRGKGRRPETAAPAASGRVLEKRRPAFSVGHADGGHDDTLCRSLQYMRGTRGVRGLHSLLMGELVSDELREALHERAQIEGYRGTREKVLLEVCVEEPDLVNFLVSEFASHQLRRAYQEKSGTKVDSTVKAEEVAEMFLESLDFSKTVRIRGLKISGDIVRRAEKKAKFSHELPDLAGCVNEASKEIEFLISSYVRFLSQAIFQKPPEVFFKGEDWIQTEREFSKAPLGTSVKYLQQMMRHLSVGNISDQTVLERMRDLCLPPEALPQGMVKISELRNLFAHDKEQALPKPSETRQRAVEFFAVAKKWLEFFGYEAEAPLFPKVIRIEQIILDRWGRRTNMAVDDRGDSEKIFTDEILLPGALYFMHPLSNPTRVDPVLVQAGAQ